MASSLSKREREMARSEGYAPLDLHESGDICYALKRHDAPENRHASGRSQDEIKKEVLGSPRMQQIILEVAGESGRDVKDVESEVEELLEEIGHKLMLPAVRTLALIIRMTLRNVLRGVYVNTGGVERLRKIVQEWPTVLLPSHRSYLDFILISFIMFEHNMKLPCIAAGQDFMNMKGVSSFLRRSGAFFLRRTFGSDQLYKAVFSNYVQTVLCSGDFPMEFFIEGTRSRSALTLHPKLGLLASVVEPYLDGRLPDIMLVPISISYERTLEEHLFAREQLGIPKPKESTSGLIKVRSLLTEDYGSIFINIGAPISLHDVCQKSRVSRIPHILFPKDMSVVVDGERQLISELGHMILDRVQQNMWTFSTSLVATILLQHPRGIRISELMQMVEWLKSQVLLHGGSVHWISDTGGEVKRALQTLSVALVVDKDTSTVRPHLHAPPTPSADSAGKKDGRLSLSEVQKLRLAPEEYEEVKEIGCKHLLLSHYRNQLLHWFVSEAMLALSLSPNGQHDTKIALRKFKALHVALSCELVLPLKHPDQLFSDCVSRFVDCGLLTSPSSSSSSLSTELLPNSNFDSHHRFLRQLLLPLVAGVWVVCQHLISFAGGVQSFQDTVKGAQLLGAKFIHAGILSTYEVLSLGVIRNGLASLTQAELIRQPTSEFEGTGKHRLVKVANQEALFDLASQLGSIIFVESDNPPLALAKL